MRHCGAREMRRLVPIKCLLFPKKLSQVGYAYAPSFRLEVGVKAQGDIELNISIANSGNRFRHFKPNP